MPKPKPRSGNTRPSLGGGTRKANQAQWNEVFAKKDPEDFPRLVAAIREAVSPIATEHVKSLSTRTKEPRLGEALLGFLTKPPYAGGQSKKFYQAVIAGLQATNDAAVRDEMVALSKRYTPIMNSFLGEWIAGALARAAAKMTPKGEAKTAKDVKPAKKSSLDELFAQIVADPDADGPRAVYADVLSEKGKKQGEFITLQLARVAGTMTEKQAARERHFRTEELDRFTPPLATAADAVTFDRGLPYAVFFKKTGLANVATEPEWGTVRKVGGVHYAPVTAVVKLLDTAPNIVEVANMQANLLTKLKRPSYAWTSIVLDQDGVDGDALARFPELRELVIYRDTPLPDGLLDGAPKLDTLRFRKHENLDATVLANRTLRELELASTNQPSAIATCTVERLVVRATVPDAPKWLAAGASITHLDICDDWDVFKTWHWKPLAQLLATSRLQTLALSQGSDPTGARFERSRPGADNWTLVWPCGGRRWHEFYAQLPSLANGFKELGVTKMLLYPDQPMHYAEAFEKIEKQQLDAIDKAFEPIVVERPPGYRFDCGEAPQEGWVLTRTDRCPSR